MKAAALDVYFDSNVYKDLCLLRCGVTRDNVVELKSYIADGRLAIGLSSANLEEACLRWESDRKECEAELRLMYELTGFNRVLKEISELLTGAIRAYSEGKPSLSPYETNQDFLNHLQAFPSHFAADPAGWASTFFKLRGKKKKFFEAMKKGKAENRELVRRIEEEKGTLPCFSEYWDKVHRTALEDFVRPGGLLKNCVDRGLDKMLEIRLIRVYVGIHLSYAYALTFEKSPKFSDSGDLDHAVYAAFSDVFVTRDRRLSALARRIPDSGFVVETLEGLLCKLRSS